MSPRIALVTAREALALDEDLPPLVAALAATGARVETPCWDDAAIDWGRYHAAVLRSTWDYAERSDDFLAWVGRCAGRTLLLNAPAIVRWNIDKHYLRELAAAGVPVVPTRFAEPGLDAEAELAEFLGGGTAALSVGTSEGFDEFVIKPAVGAGSRDAARYHRADGTHALRHLERLLAAGRATLLQPYLGSVDEQGETAVVYLEGGFSHAVRKGPLLQRGAGLIAGLFAPETIDPRRPDAGELRVAAAAHAVIAAMQPLYARIDVVRGDRDQPLVLELELAEPSLFFAHGPGSAQRFAAAILNRCAAGSSPTPLRQR